MIPTWCGPSSRQQKHGPCPEVIEMAKLAFVTMREADKKTAPVP